MNNQTEIYNIILANLNTIATGGISQAQAYADLRCTVPLLFEVDTTQAEIDKVTKSAEWVAFDTEARAIFAQAYFNAPRLVRLSDDKTVEPVAVSAETHPEDFNYDTWAMDNKAAKELLSFNGAKIRKAAQDYVRVAFRQNVTKLIPRASDAPEAGDGATKSETLPDPRGTLALVTEALQILSEKNPTGALALLNGLDALVKAARPYVSQGKPIATK